MKPIYVFTLLVYLLGTKGAEAQVRMKNLGVVDGLSQGFVTSIIQDSKGFIWIGTFDGLNRYDGYTVRRFTPKPFDPWAIQASYITRLYEDKRNLIWVGTHQGIYVFDPLSERFFNLSLPEYKIPATEVYHVTGDKNGNVFLHIPSDQDTVGLYRLNLPSDIVEQIRTTKNGIHGINVDRISLPARFKPQLKLFDCIGDTMLLARDSIGKAFRYYPNEQAMRPFDPCLLPGASLADHSIWWGKHESWFYRWLLPNGRDSLITSRGLLKAFRLGDSSIALWAPYPGIFFKKNTDQPLRIDLPFPPENLVKEVYFQQVFSPLFNIPEAPNDAVMVDKCGVVWVGTGGKGVWKINLHQLAFRKLLTGESISTIRELADGRVWLRAYSGLSILVNPKTYQFEPAPWAGLGTKNAIYDVLEDSKGRIWLIESGSNPKPFNTVWLFEKNGRRLIRFPERLPFLQDVAEKIFEDRDGTIWIAAHKGQLFRCRPGRQNLERFSYAHLSANKTNNLRATSIYQDKNGLIWIGTNHGLLRMDGPGTASPQFSLFQHDPKKLGTISVNWVTSICPDPLNSNFFWLGTRGGGLNHFDIQSQQFSFFSESTNGLSDNVVYGILPDKNGNLWCSTNRGLCRFNPQRNTFVTYLESDGLSSTEFNTNSYLRTRDGQLWFGGTSGLNVFRPEEIYANSFPPEVAFAGIKVLGIPRLPDTEGSLSLSFEENNILFEFAALDFTNPTTNRFRHRLKGIEKDWVYDGTLHSANYVALPPGKYVLELQGATADSPWSERTAVLHLTIRPPWYRSWFACLVYFLALFAAIRGIIRYREKMFRLEHSAETNQRESLRLKEFEAVKNQFFANLAHELRTPLTVILGLATRLKRGVKKEKIEENAQNIVEQGNTLLNLTNQILDLAKLESQQFALSLSNGNISQFVQHQADALMPLAESKGLQLIVHNGMPVVWMDFDPAQIQKILNNLIANAIRHSSPGGTIRIETALEMENSWLKLSVEDEGEGIAPEDLPYIFDRFYQGSQPNYKNGASGLGLTLTRDLVRLMGGEVLAESNAGKGALFTVRLPVSNQAPRTNDPSVSQPPVKKQEVHLPVTTDSHNLPLLLILEDNEAVANFLRLCLQDHFRLEMAEDGEAGIAKALELIPDIILTDVAMPKKDGFEVTSFLKNDVRTSHIPIVMLTAKVDHHDRLKGKRRGANAYLTKPFEEQELLQILNNLLHLQQQWKRRYAQFGSTQKNYGASKAATEDLQAEDEFMQKLYGVFEENYTDDAFNLERLCRLLGLSSSQLDRKLKVLADQTPMHLLRRFRLQKARELLQKKPKPNIKEVCFQTGFKSPSHFSRAFSEEFGMPPSVLNTDP
jgi:signal transduction histidine kinase/ligand-binding sensor domain-containing protein/CheY-like chemotaxis protein/AraC-like DNA-binding protein